MLPTPAHQESAVAGPAPGDLGLPSCHSAVSPRCSVSPRRSVPPALTRPCASAMQGLCLRGPECARVLVRCSAPWHLDHWAAPRCAAGPWEDPYAAVDWQAFQVSLNLELLHRFGLSVFLSKFISWRNHGFPRECNWFLPTDFISCHFAKLLLL